MLGFVIFLPIHLILLVIPSYHDKAENKKMSYIIICFTINFIFLSGSMFCLDWWLFELVRAWNIPIEIAGYVIVGIFLNLHYFKFNLK